MTYGTSHLLIGGEGVFQEEGQEKILLCKGVSTLYMKNKKIGGGSFCQLNLISKKGPNAKKLSNIEKHFLTRFAHSAFYKIHISGAANRHAPFQYAKYVFFFFFSSSSSFSKQSS